MRIYSLLLILLVLPVLSQAKEVPKYQANVEQWENLMLDYVTDWRNFVGKSRKDIKSIRIELKKIISSNPTRPKLKIIMGGLYNSEAGVIVSELKHKGIALDKIRKDADYVNVIKKLNENYKTALELDYGDLLLDDFKLINGVTTNADTRVKSLRLMQKLWNEGKRFENESTEGGHDEWFEYNTYSKIISAYVDEKRYDEALSVVNEVEKKFPSMKSEIDLGRQRITGFLKKEKIEIPKQEKPVQPATPEKPDPVVSTVKKQPVVKAEEPNKKDKVLQEENNNQAIIIGIAIGVLVLIGFMLARKKIIRTPTLRVNKN